MRKLLITIAGIATAVILSGCEYANISPGYVGKKVSNTGVHPEVYETGRHRLDNFGKDKERMILIDVSSVLRAAPVKVIMADHAVNSKGEIEQRIGLDMDFVVNVRYRLRSDEGTINSMMKDMKLGESVNEITAEQIYQKYGNMIIGRITREVLGQYTPEEVLDHLDKINNTLQSQVQDAFNKTPLIASSVSLGPITLPSVITERIQANKDTELSEAQKRAQQKIDLLNKQNEIELARQQALKEEIDAKSMANQNKILAQSVTPEVLRLRELAIREKEIDMMRAAFESGNVNATFIPYGAMDNVGAQVRMYNQ